jgi:hypothetical protein
MLLKKPVPLKTAQAKVEQIKGIYMTKEARIETRNEICRAHFHLGSDDVSKPYSRSSS